MNNNRTVYVDCTETILSRNNTGIQRNVKNIICRSEMISKEYRINVIPVISVGGKLFKYNLNSSSRLYSSSLSRVCAFLRNALDAIYFKKQNFSTCMADCSNLSVSISSHSKTIEILRLVMPFLFLMAYRLDGSVSDSRPVEMNENDIIFFTDTFWNNSTFQAITLHANVCKIVLIYDLIPITSPEVCDDLFVYMFNKHIVQIGHHINGIVTISNSESKSIQHYLNRFFEFTAIPVDYYHLGADFVAIQQDGTRVRDIVRNAMSFKNVYLIVGTIEPRKNHSYVLDAFEELWRRGEDVSLCIIGRVGWKCSDLLERINMHSLLGKSLYYFHDANDEELAFCYERCRAVVFASIAEGFGLPLVEAMSYGRRVLVSDIPVFREIGEEYPIYFPLDDLDAFVQCLYDFNHDSCTEWQPKKWITWDESVSNLFGKVLKMADESTMCRILS